ncbi:MAG: ATP-dependent helicase [Limosilactobacillus reuteri]|nr:ATP-dependent helicase [Limosilactobacillus reuteri]
MLDDSQKRVIESDKERLIVEAPAGFGKTTTMVSLVNRWLENNVIENNKKILCVTYTISAANRMKEALTNNSDSFFVTNFHGLCRRILSLYGNIIRVPIGQDFSNLRCVNTSKLKNYLSSKDYQYLLDFDKDINSGALIERKIRKKINSYNNIIRKIINLEKTISYTSILTFAIELLSNNKNILDFYRKYFPAMCVDEFQDTNILGFILVKLLSNKRVVLFGDELQKIYGFLGAIPNIFDRILDENNNYEYIRLKYNHRFSDNELMLGLDRSIRKFQETSQLNKYVAEAKNTVRAIHGETIEDEAEKISSWIKQQDGQVAILVPQNSKTSESLKNNLRKNNVQFFDATFSESDSEFINFENEVLEAFRKIYANQHLNKMNKQDLFKVVEQLCLQYSYGNSYIVLFKAFINHTIEKKQLSKRNKHVEEVLLSKSLRSYLNLVNNKVTYIKIHGSKGLEWDHVIVANFNQGEIPNYYSIQEIGEFKSNKLNEQNQEGIRKLVMLFYVAFSRAKKDFIVAYSSKIKDYKGQCTIGEISCISSLPFINIRNIN